MAPPLLILTDISLTFGGTPLLEGAAMSVSDGDRICLVGRNGSGKSTVLKIAAGLVEADDGEVFVQPGTTVRYLPQEPDLTEFQTVSDYVEAGLGPSDDPYRARHLLEQLGLSGDEKPGQISGGEARRAALARTLAPDPEILLLDEPTNHLDLPAIEWLEGELRNSRAAIVMISHDRRFLENLSRKTVWLDRGNAQPLDKGFAHFEAWRDAILEQEVTERHKLDRKIARETDWMRKGVTARRKRNQGRLRALKDLRREKREQRQVTGAVELTQTEAGVGGKRVIEAKAISKAYGSHVIVDTFSTRIQRGDRIGIIGPNGAGKTTLLNLLTGQLAPDAGEIELGANVEVVTIDQRRGSLDPTTRLADALTDGSGDNVFVAGQPKHVIGYMKDFLFAPEQARTPIGALSGGERGRLMLARALAKPSNLLILDEPTNDLDLETLDLLQEMLADYAGTVLLVSHDRDFLDRVVTSVITTDPHHAGGWAEYAGGYSYLKSQQSGGGKTASDEASENSKRGKSAKRQKAKPKLSYKDQYALETLPGEIDALHKLITTHQATLADPALFSGDPDTFEATANALKAAEADLAAAEEKWLELEMAREDAGNG